VPLWPRGTMPTIAGYSPHGSWRTDLLKGSGGLANAAVYGTLPSCGTLFAADSRQQGRQSEPDGLLLYVCVQYRGELRSGRQ